MRLCLVAWQLVLVLFYELCNSSFNLSSTTFPRDAVDLSVAYDNETDTILLFGGRLFEKQFITFKDHQFTDMNETYLPYNTYSTGQHYTQINNKIWMIDTAGENLFAVETHVPYTLYVNASYAIPNTVEERGCLASNKHYLFVVGGLNNSQTINKVQIYNIMDGQWLGTTPTMGRPRRSVSCIVVGSSLFAIGGQTDSTILNSIETLNVSNMDQIQDTQWTDLDGTLSQALMGTRAVAYNGNILVIGGMYDFGSDNTVTDVNIIYTNTGQCELWDHLASKIYVAASIIVYDTLFVFGGMEKWSSKTSGIYPNNYQYKILFTDNPTQHPTDNPSKHPTEDPTKHPTKHPTGNPTKNPTLQPSSDPIVPYETIASNDIANNSLVMNVTNDTIATKSSLTFESSLYHFDTANSVNELYSVSSTMSHTVVFDPRITKYILFAALSIGLCICIAAYLYYRHRKQVRHKKSATMMQKECEYDPSPGNDIMIELKNRMQLVNENRVQDKTALKVWLEDIVMLPQYLELFLANGYDNMEFIKHIQNETEVKEIGIHKRQHHQQIWMEIQRLQGRKMTHSLVGLTMEGPYDDNNKVIIERVEGELQCIDAPSQPHDPTSGNTKHVETTETKNANIKSDEFVVGGNNEMNDTMN